MTSGRITSITADVRGDTLAQDTIDGWPSITVLDVADFDEDETAERWLTVADSEPVQYILVDTDANTITLGEALDVTYEAGMPVVIWDPTVPGGGAPVVEYVATVETDRGPVLATIPHSLIPTSGVDFLIGASVTLDEDDDGGEVVGEVVGREPHIDGTVVRDPIAYAAKGADDPILDNTWTLISGWWAFTEDRVTHDGAGKFTVLQDGRYDLRCGVTFSTGGTGRRGVRIHFWGVDGSDGGVSRSVRVPGDASGPIAIETAQIHPLFAGQSVSFEAFQDSGGTLDIKGSNVFTTKPVTDCTVLYKGPL